MLWWTLRQLKSKNSLTRKLAVRKLSGSGNPKAVTALVVALGDSDMWVRLEVESVLRELQTVDVQAVEPLIAMLQNSDYQWGATKALGKIGNAAFEPLTAALKDADENVRCGAALALGEIGDARAVEPLITALSASNWEAAEALGKIGDVRAVEPLIGALKSVSDKRAHLPEVRRLSVAGLDTLESVLVKDVRVRSRAAEALGEIGDVRAVEPLIAALRGSDKFMHRYAAKALGKLGDARAVDQLIVALNASDSDLRTIAAESLGKIGDERAVKPLIRALKDSGEDVYVKALISIGTPEANEEAQRVQEAKQEKATRLTAKAARKERMSTICARCGRTKDQIISHLAEAKRKGVFIYGEAIGPLQYCDRCEMAFCGACQIDLGDLLGSSGCPKCESRLSRM